MAREAGNDARQDVPHQRGQVIHALLERRQVDGDHAQPVCEVLAEGLLRDRLGELAVGGRHHAHVDHDVVGSADAVDAVILEHAQELDLGGERQLGDLVEEERAAVRGLDAAHAPGAGVGVEARLVAEELALDQAFGQGAAIDRDERAVAPLAEAVQRARHQLLAGPGFPGDEHAEVGAGGGERCADRPPASRVGRRRWRRRPRRPPPAGARRRPAAPRRARA